MHTGYIVEVKDLRPHNNADKLQLATFFGETVIVGLDTKIGDIGIYFPCDLQLSEEYCDVNDLCRKRADGTNGKGYLERDKRNIKAISLRGEKSYGLYAPLSSLAFTGVDLATFKVGDTVSTVNGILICKKYIPRSNIRKGHYSEGNKTRKHKVPIAPLFAEHVDTEQLAYNLDAFRCGDEIEITLKMHGTSQRTGYLPVLKGYHDSWHCQIRNWLWFQFNRITKKNDLHTTIDKMKHDGKPYYDYGYVSGTRRVVLDNYEGGFYGSNAFREQHSKFFEGKLWKGEEIYYEVVGFTTNGTPIMANGDNKKLNDKEFVKQYGETTAFSYGCSPHEVYEFDNILVPQSDIYVYRMTMTNEDGDVVEYTPDFMRYRCEQMGVKTVPVFSKVYIRDNSVIAHNTDGTYSGGDLPDGITYGDAVKNIAEQYYDGPDPIGKTHIREGVVVRIVNRPKFCAYKHKNFAFKVLEGVIKDTADAPDMEEAQEVADEM